MAEQSGEGFFNVNQGIHKDLQEGRELIRDHDESIKLLKDLIDFDISQAEHLEEGGETDRAEESRTRAREYSKALENEELSKKEIADLYDKLYFEIYGNLPN